MTFRPIPHHSPEQHLFSSYNLKESRLSVELLANEALKETKSACPSLAYP